MKNASTPALQPALSTLAGLCAAVLVLPGCQQQAPQCATDNDCADLLYCNGVERCVDGQCQPGTDACTNGQICDEVSDTCAAGVSPFATNAFLDDFERVHGLHSSAIPNCTVCHHEEPVSAGLGSCSPCHSLDPAELNSFKEMAHDENDSGDGCRACHESEQTADHAWNCSFCHTG